MSLSTSEDELADIAPSDSMLFLNNYCLWKLFSLLDVDILCHLANVCKRFRAIAEAFFHLYHKKVQFTSEQSPRRIFSRFGHLIKELEMEDSLGVDVDGIAKYCQPNLEHLKLHSVGVNCNLLEPVFGRLKSVHHRNCRFLGSVSKLFKKCKQLESMHVDDQFAHDTIIQKFPKLKDCSLKFLIFYDRLRTFLQRNSQLKKLNVFTQSADRCFSAIAKNTPNLEVLDIYLLSFTLDNENPIFKTKEGFLELSKLKKLKHFAINNTTRPISNEVYNEFIGSLIQSFSIAKTPIEVLNIQSFTLNSMDIQYICNLKMIHTLYLGANITENDFISLAIQLPLLNHLRLNRKCSMTIGCLIEMVRVGKQLETIHFGDIKNLQIDECAFKTLAKEVQCRESKKSLSIQIHRDPRNTSFNVPDELIKLYKKHLKLAVN